ncbi:MAG: NUDIX hydrolase [Myxococcales bacterium]|nr:NUDIX hydrolase [Myxococcales bacterium]
MATTGRSFDGAGWLRLAAYGVLLDDAGRLLAVRIAPNYPSAGIWTLPGGGLDWGETPEQGLVRELHEETGLNVSNLQIAWVYSHNFKSTLSRPNEPVQAVGLVYRVRQWSGELIVERDGSTDRVEWLTRDQLAERPMTPSMRRVWEWAEDPSRELA